MSSLIHADIRVLSDQRLDEYISLQKAELQLERVFVPIATMPDIAYITPNEINRQDLGQKFLSYRTDNPVPDTLVLGVDYAKDFIESNEFNEAEAEGAVIYVIWYVWWHKTTIIDPSVKSEVERAQKANLQLGEIHKVITRIVENKSSDSFEGRFEDIIDIDEKFDATLVTHLADIGRRYGNDAAAKLQLHIRAKAAEWPNASERSVNSARQHAEHLLEALNSAAHVGGDTPDTFKLAQLIRDSARRLKAITGQVCYE